MLTVRGSFIVGAAVYLFAIGLILSSDPLAVMGLALLIWVWIKWLMFEVAMFRLDGFANSIVRRIDGQSDPTLTLVTDREYEVEFLAQLHRLPRGYRVTLTDTVPDTFAAKRTVAAVIDTRFQNRLHGPKTQVRQIYEVETPICGQVSFPGVQIELSDLAGMFRGERFAAFDQIVTVLPFLIRPQTTVSVLKHNNLQLHLGHHRHRSAGISSELHGIRDYRPGDPPRTIAWKPTARLGKWMTSEFENEVPIRSTILCDLAAYQFHGRPGPTAGDRTISTAASIAKLLLADRDPVAVQLFNEFGMRRIKHGQGERHLAGMIHQLLRLSNPHPPLKHFAIHDLLQVVFENASRRFPHLFDEHYNRGRARFSLLSRRASLSRIRRATSVALAHLLKLPYGSSLKMQFNDAALRDACLAYLQDYSIFSSATSVALDPPYEDLAHWLQTRNEMTLKLCDSLNQLRMRARDNELFIILAPEPHDLLGCEMIEAAVKNTIAARHRVLFVAPERPMYQHLVQDEQAARILIRHSSDAHRNAVSDLGERLRILGACFSRIDNPRLMPLVATEIGLLQSSASRSQAIGRARR